MGQAAFEAGQVGGGVLHDLFAQALAHADAHRLDVDAFQHRLLEAGDLLQFHAALLGDGALRTRLQQAVHRQRQASDQGQRDE